MWALCLSIRAATPYVQQLGIKDGLSNNEVRTIFQDSKGYIWFGTYDGLNRYDGYEFKVYRSNPNKPGAIIHSFINAIAEDRYHNIWVGTRQGVSVLNILEDKFSPAFAIQPGNGKPFQIRSYINDIKSDKEGNIFVGTQKSGLILFNKTSGKTGLAIPLKTGAGTQWDYNVSAITIIEGRMYLFIENIGLCYYDASRQSIAFIDEKIKIATCLYGNKQDLWVGTNNGLYHYDITRHEFDKAYSENNNGLSFNRVKGMQIMPDGQLWIGTDGGGINILNTVSGKMSYLFGGSDHYSLSSNSVFSIFLDKDGRKWIGTLRGGVNIIDDIKDRFQNIVHEPTKSNSLINDFVKSLLEDRDGRLWIGTDGGGLSIWDRSKDRFENFLHKTNVAGTLSSNFITSIKQDHTGKIWIATFGGGIDLYQKSTNTFKTYTGIDANGKPGPVVFFILYEDKDRNLWASGLQDGLFLYDRAADQFRVFDPKLKHLISLAEDNDGNLWGGTFDGIYRIDTRYKSHHYFATGAPVRAIRSAGAQQLWLGTEAGLILFDQGKDKVIKQYTTDDGLSNNNVLTIEQDKNGRLWMSTYNGLSRFDVNRRVFINLNQSDGLLNKEFNYNASLALKDGEMAFGGINGLSLFSPEKILPLESIKQLLITSIKINDDALSAHPEYITNTSGQDIKAVTIPYDQASLLVNFAAIAFTAQERINYRYIMQGWDRHWNNAAQGRNAFYSRLDPGDYELKINCSDREGQWTGPTLSLKVTILPPWYRTLWAYMGYLTILILSIYWYWHRRLREARLKYEIQLANARAEHQRSLQEKEHEINERRIEFFTGISHEFRTPLSLIINPIKDLLSLPENEYSNEMNIVYRNARRLLSLVDQLLLFRKAEKGAADMNIAPMDIAEVCKGAYLCFVQQAKVSSIDFKLVLPDDEVIIYGDREKIEIIIFNLISNAIKYTPSGQKVLVSVLTAPDDDWIEIQVSDTGNGIAPDRGGRIFDKFYRSAEAVSLTKAGFGIGLYLAKKFTDDHHGELSYESRPGQGTTFHLRLRPGFAHFPEPHIWATPPASTGLLSELAVEPVNTEEKAKKIGIPKKKDIVTDSKAILIIDDDNDMRKYICSVLEPLYLIYEAENAESGLIAAKEKRPDLIICDVMMPGMNGLELCAIIKQTPALSFIPMILLTASSSPGNKIKGLESGADDYISKPFEKDILMARVANLLQNRSTLQSYFYDAITFKSTNADISEEYKLFLEKCIEVVEQHMTDTDFNIKFLSDALGMSRSNIFRKVKSLSGHNITGFVRYIRLRKAAELLIQTDMNVNEVALAVGFNDIKYFRTQFSKLFNVSPSDFAKQNRQIFKKRYTRIR
ncbi:two-component regulator propeller domain-containing protein [Mucilaginibacter sp. PPCGB 2223]|uniref:two-component regulator propeller domain-containing protein n=1 Tax=Mucilaginibacter sp. PPCGB 2223 TaxID=1886027 RepID=UPI001585F3D9|nr:two-component regulator propeller domain-containing protein [Mucilaginibacter sp. PPCGB 2223]